MAALPDPPPLPDLARLYDSVPHARLLSNGRYTVLITGAGSGYSAWNGYALTGWRADRTADADGVFLYVRDLDRGALWSLGHQPVRRTADRYAAGAAPGRFWIEQRHAGIEARCEVCVAADADAEIRRLVLRNLSDTPRRIELTTYAEIVLNRPAAHAAHPAFSKLFVQTEIAAAGVLLARRRPRGNDEAHPWLAHALHGAGLLEYETDRARFLGRYRTPAAPRALTTATPLSGTTGGVLDPIFSVRRVLHLAPGAAAELAVVLAIAPGRAAALAAAERYAVPAAVADAFAGSAAAAGVTLRRLGISAGHADYLQELAGAMLYGDSCLRARDAVVRRARGSLDVLSRLGVRRDALLAVVAGDAVSDLLAELVRAQAYWRASGVAVDLLVLGAAGTADAVRGAGAAGAARVIVCRREELSAADRAGLLAAAHLVVDGRLPDLAPRPSPAGAGPAAAAPDAAAAVTQPLTCDNGYGGFVEDGREYVVRRRPPMPWINVVANESFGFLASERGAGYTWSGNSREHRLTPWSNDPVGDPHGEALYIRDDDGGMLWSPQPGPAPGPGPYEVRHGFGYTRWRHTGYDLEQEVVQFVSRRDAVKLTHWRLRNTGDRPRRLSLCAYYQLFLGAAPADARRFVVTEIDPPSGAVLARNRCAGEFGDGVVFAAAVPAEGAAAVTCTADRTAFVGRNGDLSAPAALDGCALDGAAGAGLDPCAALQVRVRLPPGAAVECAFLFGAGRDTAHARRLIARYRRPGAIGRAWRAVRAFWDDTLAAVQIDTPARGLDLMVNGWLLYQVLSCRLWGRSAFYQSGGAFGFRDQLQDAAALVHARPDLTRAQIGLHAAHQFAEGDVLHWWHPPAGRGIRTRFSDDLLWLPYVTAFYGHTTGDWSVLDEPAAFLRAPALAPGEDEAYLQPVPAGEVAGVYEHCCRALDCSLTQGAHGLPWAAAIGTTA